jgi:hypothetical protein
MDADMKKGRPRHGRQPSNAMSRRAAAYEAAHQSPVVAAKIDMTGSERRARPFVKAESTAEEEPQ